jgi:type IV secretion system protein VirD4
MHTHPPHSNDQPNRKHHDGRLLLGWHLPPSESGLGFQPCSPQGQPSALRQPVASIDPEGHLITIAATGKGKGRGSLIPTLLTYPGSVVVIDPKGEAVAVTSEQRRRMGQKVVILDPFRITGLDVTDGLNPFDIQPLSGQSVEDFALEAAHLLHQGQDASLKDPFWDHRGDGLNAGVIASVNAISEPEDRHLLTVRDRLMSDDVVYNLAVLMDSHGKKLPSLAHQQISSFLQTEEKCRSGILATAVQHFSVFYGAGVEASVRRTTFDLTAFRDGAPTSIYLVIPPQKLRSHSPLLRLWLGSLINAALSRTERPAVDDLFLLDEAAQLGELESLRSLMTLMRGYGVRCWSFWQDLAQLKRLYKTDWETILNNAAVVQVFGITTYLAAKALAELLGDRISLRELMELPASEQHILESGGRLTRALKLDYLKDDPFQGLYSPNARYRHIDTPSSAQVTPPLHL